MTTERDAALRAAAATKSAAAAARADAGIRELLKNQAPIDFRSVARTGGVSINFLYNHPELRGRIDRLRSQEHGRERPAADGARADGPNTVIRALTAKLAEERRRHHEETALLRAQLAAAHGQLLRLRRTSPTPATVDTTPTTITAT